MEKSKDANCFLFNSHEITNLEAELIVSANWKRSLTSESRFNGEASVEKLKSECSSITRSVRSNISQDCDNMVPRNARLNGKKCDASGADLMWAEHLAMEVVAARLPDCRIAGLPDVRESLPSSLRPTTDVSSYPDHLIRPAHWKSNWFFTQL